MYRPLPGTNLRLLMLSMSLCLLIMQLQPASIQAQDTGGPTQDELAAISKHPYIEVELPSNSDSAWIKAVQKVRQQKFADSHYYTIFRVIQDNPTPSEPVMMASVKLMELTDTYNGGGGTFYQAKSGDFVLWDHLRGPSKDQPQNKIQVAHSNSGSTDLWIDIPERGQINGYDIIMKTCPRSKYGQLQVQLRAPKSVNCTRFVIGPVTVGGPYGVSYPMNPRERKGPILLAPGDYKILFPEFDMVKSRMDFTIDSRKTTRLKVKYTSDNVIMLDE